MKELQSYKNAKRATDDLPFGWFANESQSGKNDGTPILAEQLQDLYYSLYQVIQLSGKAPNGELEDGNKKKQFLEGLCNIGIFKYSSLVAYGTSKIIFKEDAGDTVFYRSLISENKNVLSETKAWLKLITIDKNNKIYFHVATNISTAGSNLPVFCFNSGPVDANGDAALLQFDDGTKMLTLLSPSVCTTAGDETFTISENISVVLSDRADGEYIVLYDPETRSLEVCQNKIYVQKTLPDNMINGDIYIDISVMPYKEFRKVNDELKASKSVQAGLVCISGGGGGKLIPSQYNFSGYIADLNAKADKDLSNTTPSQLFIDMSISWGVPDLLNYNAVAENVWFTMPTDGLILLSAAASKPFLYHTLIVKDKNGEFVPTYFTSVENKGAVLNLQPNNGWQTSSIVIEKGFSIMHRGIADIQRSCIYYPLKGVSE